MMSLAFAVAIAQASPAIPPGDAADDIVVIGRRLHNWRGKVTTTIGITTCKTQVSSGDTEIDEIGCTALKTCWAQARPRYETARDRRLSADVRRQATESANAGLGACLKTTRDVLLVQLVERRAVARKARS